MEESCISAGVSKDKTKYPDAQASDLIGQLQKHARLGAILYRITAIDMITYVNHNVNITYILPRVGVTRPT